MSLFWYPEINEKYDFEGKPDKGMLLSSYIRYWLARLQSMFKYEGLPDTIPQKWLENILMCNGSATWIKNGDKGLVVTRGAIGGEPDVYYIPTDVIVENPYLEQGVNGTYKRDVEVVLMYNDTYTQGLLPLLKKYSAMMVEADISLNMACVMSRATLALSASDDKTRASAELWLKRIWEGSTGVIGETPFLVANSDRSLSVNDMSKADTTITNLIEYKQYIKASLYNDLGLNANYNMKREAINSNESQLNDDMLHPLIDTMLQCRREGLEKVNAMFGTNITVDFNSAWAINEQEEQAAIKQMENEADGKDNIENSTDVDNSDINTSDSGDNGLSEGTSEEMTEETPDEIPEGVEVTITEDAIEEIADKVAEKLEEDNDEEKEGEE
jgi:hypothetical protein